VIAGVALALGASVTQGDIAATHIYHNHMPNFWPFYDVTQYDSLSVGAPIRYMYDGQVKQLKASSPHNYSFFIPGIDTLVSPPNRADLQNASDIGSWVSLPMFNERQVTQNKFPFASIPHWVRHGDPQTGQEYRIAGIPVEQASSWEEGYQGQVTAGVLKDFEDEAGSLGRVQYFVIAHDAAGQ
jgi:hypothetical protein